MKTISKRISAVLLSFYMVFGVVSSDYLTVQAFEWVVPSLTVGDSILWLMGLLGIAYTDGAAAWRDVSPEYEQDFIDYANEHGLTYTETSTWLNDTASGKLNQLSQVWTNFKEWVRSLFSSNSGDVITGLQIIDLLKSPFPNINSISPTDLSTFNVKYAMYFANSNGVFCCLFNENYNFSVTSTGFYFQPLQGAQQYYSGYYPSTSTSVDFRTDQGGRGGSFSDSTQYYLYGVSVPSSANCHLWDFLGSNDNTNTNVYNPALIPDINFAGANTEDSSIPGVIDLPWGNLGDDEEERDKTYDDLVGGLDLGKEIGDLWQALQDLMGVLAVDDAGVLQPNSGGENPPTLEDEAENNKVNGAFVLTGLQKVFPFCIPFDLYAFITLLKAPPVAPVIEYPIYNPVTKSNEIITIDFSTWESVVVLFRYIFDFLFIIGLLLMARALIGGGDSA